MIRFLSTAVLFLATYSLNLSQTLPRGMTPEEKAMLAEGFVMPHLAIPGEFGVNGTPDAPRAMAEWEEQQALVITWAGFQPILREIVRSAKEEVTVIIVTTNENSVRSYLENNGIDLSQNVEFVDAAFNTIWVRDYGGNPAYLRDVDSLVFVDWIYNRPRPQDDLVPFAVGEHLGVPVYSTDTPPDDLVHTGGNFMSDGRGRGFSSNLVLDENEPGSDFGITGHDPAAVDDIMNRYLGISEFVRMTVLPYDAIHHIDMHMKLVDESTLVVGQYPEGVADGPQIEANLLYVIDQFKQQTGRDYRVVRIPMPPDASDRYPDNNGHYRTYANAMIVNGTILVPVYEEQYDTTALRIWQETMPGYKITGINCNSIIPLSGALHCITKEVGVHEPLWISHFQPEVIADGEPATLEATIRHISGIESAWLFHRVKGSIEYDSLPLVEQGADIWQTTLSEYPGGSEIEYFFKATATDGKQLTRPIPAPEGFFRLLIESGTTAVSDVPPARHDLSAFPNPANAITCIPVKLTSDTHGVLSISDLHGRTLSTLHEGSFPAGESNYFINAAEWEPGLYVLRLATESGGASMVLAIQ